MLETLKRWRRNIAWLLNHPPLSVTNRTVTAYCDYCGGAGGIMTHGDVNYPTLSICHNCKKKAFDAVLTGEERATCPCNE